MADQEQQEIFDAARETEDELLKGTFEPEQPPAEEAERPARARNADGTFARAQAEQPAEQAAEQPAEAKPEEEEILPSWRAREINEERRRVQAENESMRAEYARMQARMAQLEQQLPKPQAPAPIDPVLDPQGFTKQFQENLTAQFEQRLASIRLETNLENAHIRFGETFEKAYEALLTQGQRGNNALVRHLISQPNPGNAIVGWFNDAMMRSEIGGDFSKYKETSRKATREELLNDETFLQEASERLRQRALGGGQPPNTVVKLPPSLTRATGSADQSAASNDGSEEALFAYAMNSKRR